MYHLCNSEFFKDSVLFRNLQKLVGICFPRRVSVLVSRLKAQMFLVLNPGVQHFYLMGNTVQCIEFNFQLCLCDFIT